SKIENASEEESMYFWAIGDLHFCAKEQWKTFQTQRLTLMYTDLRSLWSKEGAPDFCVSPGDIIELNTPENFQLAKKQMTNLLGNIPFYPGLGNHELYAENTESEDHLIEDFEAFWGKPVRYYWVVGEALYIMLDPIGYPEPYLTQESLTFLQTALAKHPGYISVIFCHCPLYNTVLDRDPVQNLDYHSLDPFFALQNSADIRTILGKYKQVRLFLSGHTHSGWGAPHLVYSEELSGHQVTFVNLMSPWYTGFHKGATLNEDGSVFEFEPDDPDLIVSFAFHIYRDRALIRLREHRTRSWMAHWNISFF
ncbi:MAG TPA: metallophosphoesterase, partial [Ktedonobacteraceae bacterium]|nr:metallophosphoesterase [Ktedonobacteraceae bacterium]